MCPEFQLSPLLYRMSGVHTSTVNPPRNVHTEYDINMRGPCHVNIIFLRGTMSCAESLLVDKSKGWYLCRISFVWKGLTVICVGPKIYKTVTSDAESRIPSTASIRLECHMPILGGTNLAESQKWVYVQSVCLSQTERLCTGEYRTVGDPVRFFDGSPGEGADDGGG